MRLPKNKILVLTLIASALFPAHTKAQSASNQLWLEYFLNYPFANSYNLQNAFNYSTNSSGPKWRSYGYSLEVDRSITQFVDLEVSNVVNYTNQTDSYNTLEIRPVLALHFYFTPNSRIQTRLLLRGEQRNFEDLDTKEWTQKYRSRARAEMFIPINQNSFYMDNQWYGILDAEIFFTQDDLKERYANQFRLRTGLGYRLNYSLRFEFIYMLQASRNGIDQTITSDDNVFRFRLKQFLRKSKPSDVSGDSN